MLCVTLYCLLHLGAVAFDGKTTAIARNAGFTESDPIARVFIGRHQSDARMAVFGTAEVLGVAALARRHPRMKWLEVGLSAVHIGCGVANLEVAHARPAPRRK